jgi:hypothetical protein
MIAAKHSREGAEAGLKAIGGLQENASREAIAANQVAAEMSQEAQAQQAQQADRDRSFSLQESQFGLSQANAMAAAEQQAKEQALNEAKQTDANTKEAQAAAQQQLQRQGTSELVAAQLGLTRGKKGYERPGVIYGTNPATPEEQAQINAALTGVNYRDILGAPKAR